MTLPVGSDAAAFRRLWRLTERHRGLVLRGMALRFLQAVALGFAIALAVLTIAGLARPAPPTAADVMRVAALMGAALVAQVAFAMLATKACWVASHRIAGHLRLDMLERLRRLPMDFHAARQRGDAIAALTGDMLALEVFIADGLPRLAQALGLPVALFCLLAVTDWLSALAASFSVLLALPVLVWSSRRLVAFAAARQAEHAAAASRAVEHVQGMKVIRAFNGAGRGHPAFRRAVDRLHDAAVDMIATLTAPVIAFSALVMLGLPLLLVVLGLRLEAGTVPGGGRGDRDRPCGGLLSGAPVAGRRGGDDAAGRGVPCADRGYRHGRSAAGARSTAQP